MASKSASRDFSTSMEFADDGTRLNYWNPGYTIKATISNITIPSNASNVYVSGRVSGFSSPYDTALDIFFNDWWSDSDLIANDVYIGKGATSANFEGRFNRTNVTLSSISFNNDGEHYIASKSGSSYRTLSGSVTVSWTEPDPAGPPGAPTTLTINDSSDATVEVKKGDTAVLKWSGATNGTNNPIASYTVYRDGAALKNQITTTSYTVESHPTVGGTYTFYVVTVARDGQTSGRSPSKTLRTIRKELPVSYNGIKPEILRVNRNGTIYTIEHLNYNGQALF